MQFCDTVSPDSICLFEDKATNYIEFNRKIYEKEVEYGVYFLLGRRKDSPTTEKKKLQFLQDYFKR